LGKKESSKGKEVSLFISKDISTHLFLSNLIQSSDDKIESLILSLKTIVENKTDNKLTYLNSLDYKLKHIRKISIVKEIEEKKAMLYEEKKTLTQKECYLKYFNCDDDRCPYFDYCRSECSDSSKLPEVKK